MAAAAAREQRLREKTRGSWERFQRAQKSLAGGVSSAVRRAARPYPLYFTHGAGSTVTDVDGNQFLDYGLAWGPLILGHSPEPVVEAVARQLRRGLTFGAQHDLEFEVAEMLTGIIPCADRVCFANSGTEIVQCALRLARAVTGRSAYLKFEGHYHGWDDSVLVSHHPTAEQLAAAKGAPVPASAGQVENPRARIAQWNDFDGVRKIFADEGERLSAVICEPMLCNSGSIPPEPGFLELLRDLTLRSGALLIFDEVITGFRLHLKGGQGFYGVTPDLATYAKAVAGGAPLSVLAGRSQFMDWIARGEVVHAGSLNGNPVSLAAAKATLEVLSRDHCAIYDRLWRLGERLRLGLERILRARGFAAVTSGGGPVFHVSFMERTAKNYRETLAADAALYGDFALALLDEGILVLPDGRWYLSTAHSEPDIDATLEAAERAVEE